jgi:hypothetical protein
MQSYDRSYFTNIFLREKENSHRNQGRLKELRSHQENGDLQEIGCGLGGFTRMAVEKTHISTYPLLQWKTKN